jgi:glycosyltransferase involved in cell wall biosynthesis
LTVQPAPRRSLRGLRERVALTYEHLGLGTLLFRVVTYPLRFTPLRLPLGLGDRVEQHRYDAGRWQRREAPPVTVIRPGDPLAAPPGHDLAIVGDGLSPHCVAVLQHAARVDPGAAVTGGIVGAIDAAGLCRSHTEPEQLVGRYAGRPAGHRPAQIAGPVLAAAPGCALVTAEALGPATLEEVCAQVWRDGGEVHYTPLASAAGPAPSPGRIARTPAPARTPDGGLRVVYVTEETGVGGGHRDIFEHINRLRARGHDVSLFTLDEQPTWFDLAVEVTTFEDFDALSAALRPLDAIKIATWWRTAIPVWRAAVERGAPAYFVQDIETSYYHDMPWLADRVLDTYRNEFRYMTISGWNRERLAELGLDAALVAPGIDLDTFRPLGLERRADMLLAVGRSHHLKNLDLTLDAWKALGDPRPEMCLFGIEPELGPEHGARYVEAPSDAGVNELMNQATIFLQTSRHEGFALPPLEAMAGGAAVVCTDAHGNRDFCRDGENCLIAEPTVQSVRGAIERLLADPELRRRLGAAGVDTAREYAWERRIDTLEAFLEGLAEPN